MAPIKQGFEFHCRGCGSSMLYENAGYQTLSRISSDCRPINGSGQLFECNECGLVQKVVNTAQKEDLTEIYNTYQTYKDGIEPLTFSSGIGEIRTTKICEQISSIVNIFAHGRILDIGCGDGSFLKAFQAEYPEWSLFGFDINERRRTEIELICGPGGFVCKALSDLPGEMDLITMNYVLEHVADVATMIPILAGKLSANGVMAFLVPDLERNPYDIVVADHLSHFTHNSVRECLLSKLNLECYQCLEKEIFIIGRPKTRDMALDNQSPPVLGLAEKSVEILKSIRAEARELAIKHPGPFGILGTAIAGSWLSQEMQDLDHFFVDEDSRKANIGHLGKKVVAPLQIPINSIVYLPFGRNKAQQIIGRMSSISQAKFIKPSPQTHD